MFKLGVIGCGVVGQAVLDGFKARGQTVVGYDKYKEGYAPLAELMDADAIFICVPTPTRANGLQDQDALHEVCQQLMENGYKGIVALKSTVLPGTTDIMREAYGLKRLVHNPEFLTAATPLEDFLAQPAVLIGGPSQDAFLLADIYQLSDFKCTHVYQSVVTEMAKYMHNILLAVKVGICNDINEICKVVGADYDCVRDAALVIGQIGTSHTKIACDGKPGYGGMCFPKDTRALLRFGLSKDLGMETLMGAVMGNDRRRPEEA